MAAPGTEETHRCTPSFAVTGEGSWAHSSPFELIYFFTHQDNSNNTCGQKVAGRLKQDESKMRRAAQYVTAVFFVSVAYGLRPGSRDLEKPED